MPVYRLTPLDGTACSPQWRASSIHPYCLWVCARDEHEARSVVAKATTVPHVSQRPYMLAPWKDPELVACEYDDSKDVAPGIIRVRSMPYIAVPLQLECRLSA